MKKLLTLVLSLLMIMTVGCSKEDNEYFEKYMEEGKMSVANQEYDKALNFFTLAKEEKEDDEELNSLYNQTKSLVEAMDSKEKKDYDTAIQLCENIRSIDSKTSIIKEAADKLKKECIKLKEEKKNSETKKVEQTSNQTSNKTSKKQYFQTRLSTVESQVSELENSPEFTGGSMLQLREVQGKCYLKWDGLLNEIYGALKNQLSQNEIDSLTNKQREWIKYRDSETEKAGEEYKGGTMEIIEKNATITELTRQRCYELVNKYVY